jgi:4-alpha-glucanotransferase
MQSRVLGITCPLFSLRSEDDWGKGQISDLLGLGKLAKASGARLLQILPPHELTENESSPYGAMTAFALDPTYITLSRVPELAANMPKDLAAEGNRLAGLATVDYAGVLGCKKRALAVAFDTFVEEEWKKNSARAEALLRFSEREPWVFDYALYSVLRDSHNGGGFSTWPDEERFRKEAVLAQARPLSVKNDVSRQVLARVYTQWLAFTEWQEVKKELGHHGIALMGDLPFIVGTESADVWSMPASFDATVSLGAPPDDFSADGQDWGLPAYTAEELSHLTWLGLRSHHASRLYDAFRIDHVVGFFRQWVKPHATKKGEFRPGDEALQAKLGAHILAGVKKSAGQARVIAEDLGVIPPFVRSTLKDLDIPGYKVVPWEKDARQVVRSPQEYPALSVATFGTHDTAPITSWWAELQPWEREQIATHAGMRPDAPEAERHVKLSRMLLASPANVALLQIQELIGDGDRVNLPGTVGPHNWTYRIAKPVDELLQDARIADRLQAVREASEQTGRAS